MKKLKGILIIGILPPPIGGITIHVKRLCEYLEKSSFPFEFVGFRNISKWSLLKEISKHPVIHLHTSNPMFRFTIALFCSLFIGKKLIVTFHGDIGQFGRVRNLLDIMTIWLANEPIVLNKKSYKKSIKYNRHTKEISAFIPASKVNELETSISKKIKDLRSISSRLFATNASYLNYDSKGREIYQISALLSLFTKRIQDGLIISDPSGSYHRFFLENDIQYPNNILLINHPHDFNAIIKVVDCVIRFTTTDGDSLTVKESLFLGKPIIATNVVPRPPGTILIDNNIKSLEIMLDNKKLMDNRVRHKIPNGAESLIELYREILR